MLKEVLLFCAFSAFSAGWISPVSAAAEYVAQADIDQINQEIQASNYRYCPGYWTGRSEQDSDRAESYRWMTDLMLLGEQSGGTYNRYTIPFKGKNVSMILPHQTSWKLRGKQVRPYLMTGSQVIEVGALDFIDSSIQDYTCSLERRYKISLERGSIQSKTKALQQEVKALKTAGSQPDDSQDLPTVSLSPSLALVPDVVQNSGGFSLQYSQVTVNLAGGWVMTISSKGGYSATVDPFMLRIAVSAR
ncbi:hypothetical protein KBD34_03080 [Patescibacteria group bacterium]|nr:hypothetical protein [Patescibacteria group bacterium]